MKKTVAVLIILSLMIGCFCVFANGEDSITGTFRASSEMLADKAEFSYSDSYFEKSSYEYNHNLAKLSLRLAVSAFADNKKGYAQQYKNASDMLEKMKFKNILWNEDFEKKPELNSIGVIAGQKSLGDSTTLIAVAIRGGNYEAEWGGNFNVGNGKIHEGFGIARDEAIAFLAEYIKKNGISGNVKIWITGYSRGGAVANLTGAFLNENIKELGSGVTASPENIYTYCFAAPSGVKNPPEEALHNNIFTIINKRDFIPKLMMQKWNYGRYGITYCLKGWENTADYSTVEKNMIDKFNSYVKQDYKITSPEKMHFTDSSFVWDSENGFSIAEMSVSDPAATVNYMQGIADVMADTFVHNTVYTEKYQNAFINFGEEVIGNNKMEEFFSVLGNEIMSGFTRSDITNLVLSIAFGGGLENELYGKLSGMITATEEKTGITLDESVDKTLYEIIKSLLLNDMLDNLLSNTDIIAFEHSPEVYLAWMDASDEKNMEIEKRIKSDEISVIIDGRRLRFDQPPIIENGRTLVPLRAIFEALGATVNWNQDTYTVTAKKGNTTVIHTVGSNVFGIDEKAVEVDVPSMIINSRTLVPVRAVAESFNCNVEWDNDTRTVIIK